MNNGNTEIAEGGAAERVQRVVRHPEPVLLIEPIDCEALARSYRAVRWQWWDGYPTAEIISKAVAEGKADLATRPGPRQVCNSGGINIEWLKGEIVVLVASKLAAEYQKPQMPNAKLSDSASTTQDSNRSQQI